MIAQKLDSTFLNISTVLGISSHFLSSGGELLLHYLTPPPPSPGEIENDNILLGMKKNNY